MTASASPPATLDEWIEREAIRFALDEPASVAAGVAAIVAALGDGVELLGLGEALHFGEDFLVLRNRVFQCLVESHGYSAIAVESSFPRARLVNDYVAGRGPAAYEDVEDRGFSHGFGRLAANRELVEWMRRYNADPGRRVELRFYGFDIPGLVGGVASPREVLDVALACLTALDPTSGAAHRERIAGLLGDDAAWENPAALTDPSLAPGRSPTGAALRLATEDLITELRNRRPELIAGSDLDRYQDAAHHAEMARQLLAFHAVLAGSPSELLAIRDASMADNLAHVVARERGRGKVLAFAHNSHLQRGKAALPWAAWWPAGAHLHHLLGPAYAVIGAALGVSPDNGIGAPEAGTLEARLLATPGPARFIATHRGQGLAAAELAALPTRSGSTANASYIPLAPRSLDDFDWLAVLDATTYSRGAPPLPAR